MVGCLAEEVFVSEHLYLVGLLVVDELVWVVLEDAYLLDEVRVSIVCVEEVIVDS